MNLYPHQLDMLADLKDGKRVIVAPCRTGKTRPGIEFLRGLSDVLVLTRKAAIKDWESELQAMGVSGWEVTNTEKLRSKNWNGRSKNWNGLILDEFHAFFSTYPKPSQVTKPCWELEVSGPRVGMSATPCSESYSQLFHQAKALKLPIWQEYKNFYSWFREYGIPKQIRAHGRLVALYTDVKSRAWEEFKEFCIVLDRAKVIPDFTEAHNIEEEIESQEILDMCLKLKRDQILRIGDQVVVAETPLALAQKCSQICAGVVLDDMGKPVRVNTVKRDWIRKRFLGRKTAILTQFKAEVEALTECNASNGSVSDFQAGLCEWVIGNIASLNAGVNLVRADGLVITGTPWSVTQYLQARERLLNKERTREAPVYFPVIKGGIDQQIYRKVAVDKVDFHARMYE